VSAFEYILPVIYIFAARALRTHAFNDMTSFTRSEEVVYAFSQPVRKAMGLKEAFIMLEPADERHNFVGFLVSFWGASSHRSTGRSLDAICSSFFVGFFY
jgi:hypothetical protein